jgi:anaphase-promoting complex subunit 6
MAAYRTASRLFPGCHKASLYIGMEYMRMNNTKTALMQFKEAHRLNKTDPLVLNEIAVVYYHSGDYE